MDAEAFYDAKAELYIYSQNPSWDTIDRKYSIMYDKASAYKKPKIKKAYDYLYKRYGRGKIDKKIAEFEKKEKLKEVKARREKAMRQLTKVGKQAKRIVIKREKKKIKQSREEAMRLLRGAGAQAKKKVLAKEKRKLLPKKIAFDDDVIEGNVPYEPRKAKNYEEILKKKSEGRDDIFYSKDPMYVEIRERKVKAMKAARENLRIPYYGEEPTMFNYKELRGKYVKGIATMYGNEGKKTDLGGISGMFESVQKKYDTQNLQDTPDYYMFEPGEKIRETTRPTFKPKPKPLLELMPPKPPGMTKEEIFEFNKPSPPAVQPLKCPSEGKEPDPSLGYKAQVLIFHPDKNPGCEEEAAIKMKKLNNMFAKKRARKPKPKPKPEPKKEKNALTAQLKWRKALKKVDNDPKHDIHGNVKAEDLPKIKLKLEYDDGTTETLNITSFKRTEFRFETDLFNVWEATFDNGWVAKFREYPFGKGGEGAFTKRSLSKDGEEKIKYDAEPWEADYD